MGYMDYGVASGVSTVVSIIYYVVCLAVCAFTLFCEWQLFTRAGKPGWAVLIPVYNMYVLFDIVYGKGISFLKLLIPFYNIYVLIKFYLDLARCYGQPPAFGIGLWLLSPIFFGLLTFRNAGYLGPVSEH